MRLGMNATSAINKAKNIASSWTTGKILQPEQRRQIVEAVTILSDAAEVNYLNSIQPVLMQADEEGIDRKFLLSPALMGKSNLGKDKKEEAPKQETKSYSEKQEKAIQLVMDKNKVSRQEAISALTEAGKL